MNPDRYTLEQHRWEPTETGGPRRSRVPVAITAYIPAPLQEQEFRFSAQVTAALADAQAALEVIQADAATVGIDTIARQLLRSESMASSQMEGVDVPSHRSLSKTESGRRHREGAVATIANIEALRWAYRWAREDAPWSVKVLQDVHARLATADRWIAQYAGEVRERQNWIGRDRHTPAGAEFIPPPPGNVPALLNDLCAFLRRRDLPPVAQAAIAHVQFETVHPFADGNGRVGRALIGAALIRSRVCSEVVPPLSLVLARDKDAYVDALMSYRYGDDDRWLLLLSDALIAAADASRKLAQQVRELQAQWRKQAGSPRADSTADLVIGLLPRFPMLDAPQAAALLGRSDVAARNALIRLEEAGVLSLVTVAKSQRVWEPRGLFALIDEMERSLSGGVVGSADTGGAAAS